MLYWISHGLATFLHTEHRCSHGYHLGCLTDSHVIVKLTQNWLSHGKLTTEMVNSTHRIFSKMMSGCYLMSQFLGFSPASARSPADPCSAKDTFWVCANVSVGSRSASTWCFDSFVFCQKTKHKGLVSEGLWFIVFYRGQILFKQLLNNCSNSQW